MYNELNKSRRENPNSEALFINQTHSFGKILILDRHNIFLIPYPWDFVWLEKELTD